MSSEIMRDTQALLNRAITGDDFARRTLLEHYRDRLRRMVSARLDRRLAPRVDASDIVQETLAEASARLDEFLRKPEVPLFGWLRFLASERVLKAHRHHLATQRRSINRESRLPELSDASAIDFCSHFVADDTSPSNRMSRQEEIEKVMTALEALSPRDREVLVMRHFEQLSTAEIAEALELTEAGVKARLLRALARIRGLLKVGS